MRLQENASIRPTRDVTEGRLRNTEAIGTVERTASRAVAATASEARHRLQEGTKMENYQTASVEIPRQTAASHSATSVPNYVGTRAVGVPATSELSTSLRKPEVTKLSPSKPSVKKAFRSPAVLESENPFKDNYDETKNPFADEEPTNPFGDDDDDDYNDSLNPFAE
jgi:hypothetical protein